LGFIAWYTAVSFWMSSSAAPSAIASVAFSSSSTRFHLLHPRGDRRIGQGKGGKPVFRAASCAAIRSSRSDRASDRALGISQVAGVSAATAASSAGLCQGGADARAQPQAPDDAKASPR
jgi:hypothetical protein